MSISEQVKELKELAENPEIEHIKNKWHLFNERLPNNRQKVIVSKDGETLEDLFEFCVPDSDYEGASELRGFLYGECHDGITVLNTNENELAWMPLPKSNINVNI